MYVKQHKHVRNQPGDCRREDGDGKGLPKETAGKNSRKRRWERTAERKEASCQSRWNYEPEIVHDYTTKPILSPWLTTTQRRTAHLNEAVFGSIPNLSSRFLRCFLFFPLSIGDESSQFCDLSYRIVRLALSEIFGSALSKNLQFSG